MRIGFTEILLIIIVAMALIRPDKLKEYSKTLGKAFKTFKDEKDKVEAEIIEPLKDDIDIVKEPIDEVMEPVNDIKEMVKL